jgi:hypothetical protein
MASKHRARRGGSRGRAAGGVDRRTLIDQLIEPGSDIDLILLKRPSEVTEAEVRKVGKHRLGLPPGLEKERLDAFERAYYEGVYGNAPVIADETGRFMPPLVKRAAPDEPVPARSADGMDLSRAVLRLAEQVADIAETWGSRDAVRALQRGLTILEHAASAAQSHGEKARVPLPSGLKDDGDPGPRTCEALRRATARFGASKVEEALALGRFDSFLRMLENGAAERQVHDATASTFGALFRDRTLDLPDQPTEEGESLQMSLNDLGPVLIGAGRYSPVREDGRIGPRTEAALKRVLKAAGPQRLVEAMGRNLGFFLFNPSDRGGREKPAPSFTTPEAMGGKNFDN